MTEHAPPLRVQFTKRADGRAVLRCVRADGSATWQVQNERLAQFFPFHDLTHFAVETTLGFLHGFYGLIAGGWEIDETTGKGARGPLPREALLVEHIVGLFDRGSVGRSNPMSADELNEQLTVLASTGRIAAPPTLTDEQIAAVRTRVAELHDTWARLEPGGTMELPFPSR